MGERVFFLNKIVVVVVVRFVAFLSINEIVRWMDGNLQWTKMRLRVK